MKVANEKGLPIAIYPISSGLTIDILAINYKRYGDSDSVVYKFSDSPKVYETNIQYDGDCGKTTFCHPSENGYGDIYYYMSDFISTGN